MSRYTGRKRKRISGGFYKRPWTKRRAMYRRRRTYRQSAGARALIMIRKIKRDEEMKEHYGAAIAVTMPLADTWSPAIILNGIVQGNAAHQRIGQKIVMKSLMMRGNLAWNAAETSGSNNRLVIVYDRRPIRTDVATGAQIFTSDNSIGLIQSQNKQYAGRFQILYDKVFHFPRVPADRASSGRRHVKIYIPMNLKTQFNAAGAIQTNFDKGQLLMLGASTSASHNSTWTSNVKLKYSDL